MKTLKNLKKNLAVEGTKYRYKSTAAKCRDPEYRRPIYQSQDDTILLKILHWTEYRTGQHTPLYKIPLMMHIYITIPQTALLMPNLHKNPIQHLSLGSCNLMNGEVIQGDPNYTLDFGFVRIKKIVLTYLSLGTGKQ